MRKLLIGLCLAIAVSASQAQAAADPALVACAIANAPGDFVAAQVESALDTKIEQGDDGSYEIVKGITLACLSGKELPERTLMMAIGYNLEAIIRDGVRRKLEAGGYSVAPIDKFMKGVPGPGWIPDGSETTSLERATDKAVRNARGKAVQDPALDKAARVYMSLTTMMRIFEREL